MWSNFFAAGGWGMYPTTVFGFVLLAAIGLHALRPEPRFERVITALMIIVVASGLLGTCVGVCNTVHYLEQVPADKQFITFANGTEESLHNLVLALIIVVIANLIAAVIAFRNRAAAVR
jgi:hypothetical protein